VNGLLRAVAALVGRLPWGALAALGAVLGWLAGSVLRVRRSHVREAMRAAGVDDVERVAGRMYRSLGTSAAEFLWLAGRGEAATPYAVIDPSSRARWREAIARGRGVVLAASHTGNWDLAACAMARDIELLVVTKRLSARSLDRFWQTARAARGIVLVDARGAMAHGLGALRRGGAVAMMIDQVPDHPHSIDAEFLGRPARVDRAPATLAAAGGAPLVVAASRRDDGGGHLLHVLDVLVPPERPGRSWIDHATAVATGALDAFVRAHPSQWLWLHRRWKGFGVDRGPDAATLASSWGKIRSSSPGARSKAA
jgi:KDO2-lipid IV(A) lauroyltransferase